MNIKYCPYLRMKPDHKTSSSCVQRQWCAKEEKWCSEVRKVMHSSECIFNLKRKEKEDGKN